MMQHLITLFCCIVGLSSAQFGPPRFGGKGKRGPWATAVLQYGTVKFFDPPPDVSKANRWKVIVNLSGLPPNMKLGLHIHESGDIADGCAGAGGHYNPTKTTHGDRWSSVRHTGDLGNIQTDADGTVNDEFEAVLDSNIRGVAIVLHQGTDDLGQGGDDGSLATGNAGGRLDCAVIS